MFKDWLAGASTRGWVGFGGDAGGGLLAEPDVAEVRPEYGRNGTRNKLAGV
jgi:hypothetical protein